ncbi:MAG TPA: hypothetical protein VFP49_05120 [Nitrososphaeraceae archaeon]|nr:hypothetical protein [Nitrososphaeraceae archaeon]
MKTYSTIFVISILFAVTLIATTEIRPISFENVLAQQNDDGSIDTELGGDPELGGDTGMTESDMGGKDIGMTVSDLENDTDITNNNQTD